MSSFGPLHSARCGSSWGRTCDRCRRVYCARSDREAAELRAKLFPKCSILGQELTEDPAWLEKLGEALMREAAFFRPIIKELSKKQRRQA